MYDARVIRNSCYMHKSEKCVQLPTILFSKIFSTVYKKKSHGRLRAYFGTPLRDNFALYIDRGGALQWYTTRKAYTTYKHKNSVMNNSIPLHIIGFSTTYFVTV